MTTQSFSIPMTFDYHGAICHLLYRRKRYAAHNAFNNLVRYMDENKLEILFCDLCIYFGEWGRVRVQDDVDKEALQKEIRVSLNSFLEHLEKE